MVRKQTWVLPCWRIIIFNSYTIYNYKNEAAIPHKPPSKGSKPLIWLRFVQCSIKSTVSSSETTFKVSLLSKRLLFVFVMATNVNGTIPNVRAAAAENRPDRLRGVFRDNELPDRTDRARYRNAAVIVAATGGSFDFSFSYKFLHCFANSPDGGWSSLCDLIRAGVTIVLRPAIFPVICMLDIDILTYIIHWGNLPASQAAPEIPTAWAMRKPKGWECIFWLER